MRISKTAFKEYARCNRIYPLERIYYKKLDANISHFDKEDTLEILLNMFDEDTGEDFILKDDSGIDVMLEYYNKVEEYALDVAGRKFGGDFRFSLDTKEQKVFSFDEDGHNFYSYLDGYLEKEDEIIIIEVKSTTSKKFIKAGSSKQKLFHEENGILEIASGLDFDDKILNDHYNHLFNMNKDTGKYVFDLAIERYIIEKSINMKYPELKNKKIKYYLAVLNSNYVFDGKYENGKPVYTDELITFIDLTDVTQSFLELIANYKKNIVEIIESRELEKQIFAPKCRYKSQDQCIFFNVCFPTLTQKGSVMEYMGRSLIGPDKNNKMELYNEGMEKLDDVPYDWLYNDNHIIQRDCHDDNKIYINEDKIREGINAITYPIYHLDFESFNAPLPRFKGEKPYTQSLFQFSIHVERTPGACDLLADNHYFLAEDHSDIREALIKKMIEVINLDNGGTVLVYNQSFEETRIKELINYYPQYKVELTKIKDALFDLMHIIRTNSKLYTSLGFSEEESKIVNYYNNDLVGSYSIKKVLPIFSKLSYSELDVQNGGEAMISYAKLGNVDDNEKAEIRSNLIDYCRQDTWAMFLILEELRKLV